MSEACVLEAIGAGGYRLACRWWSAGDDAPVVVMVHGVVSHSLWLEPVATRLQAAGIATLAADRRGAGLNDIARGDAPDADSLRLDLAAVLARAASLGGPVHLAGFCWGANHVVDHLAGNRGGEGARPATLTLLAPSLFPSERILARSFRTGLEARATEEPVMPIECFTDGPAFDAFILPDPLRLRRVSPRLNGVMAELAQGMWMKFLRLELPTLLILGSDDEVVDNRATERLFGRLRTREKRLAIVAGRHGVQFDAPETVAREVTAHVLRRLAEHHDVEAGT